MTSTEASSSEEKAATLRALHVPGDPLVLPNAWDAASARMVEAAGFPVVATSSFATARILSYDDGEAAPVEDVAGRGRTDRPRGEPAGDPGLRPGDRRDNRRRRAGGLPGRGRSAAVSAGVDLVINARTDSFLRPVGSPEEQLAASIERGARYVAAGADCVYPIGPGDPSPIRALVEDLPGAVNVGYGRGKLSLAELAALGVARVSFGPTLQQHLYDKFGSGLLAAVASDETPFVL